MGRLITAGFETKDATLEGYVSPVGTVTFDTATVRSGAAALRIQPVAEDGHVQWAPTMSTGTTYYARVYVRLPALPTAFLAELLRFDAGSVRIEVTNDGRLALNGTGVTQAFTAVGAVQAGTWIRIELSILIGAGAIDAVEARLDGASWSAQSGLSISDAAPTYAMIGGFSASTGVTDEYFDDFALNDSAGASQNTWPGDGKVVLLLPTATSAAGTNWRLGTNAALGGVGHQSVDNTPPVGVADLAVGSDPKQIRNAGASANDSFDTTMTTYSAAGIAAIDTINVIDPITATGAPVTTSAKAGTVGVVSNPAIANVALGAGGTAGAFWSGVTAGTYPTGWKINHGTITYGSSVTVGTAPVMRVTQVTSSTRIAMVCFMGIYVDYTPGVPARVPYVNPMPPILAQ